MLRRFFCPRLVLIVLMLLITAQWVMAAEPADEARQRGWKAFEKEDYQAAVEAFDEVLKQEPDSVDTLIGRARSYANLEKTDEAFRDAQRAVELAPDNAEALTVRGTCYFGKNDYPKAIDDFQRAIELDPKLVPARGWLAQTYAANGDIKRAISVLDEAIQLTPDDVQLLIARAKCHAGSGNYQQSLADCDEAVRIAPQQADTYFMRAVMRVHQCGLNKDDNTGSKSVGEIRADVAINQVLDDLNKAIELDPEAIKYRMHRVSIYIIIEAWEKVVADTNEIVRLDPENAYMFYIQGSAYLSLDRPAKALVSLNEAIRINPSWATLYCIRGACYLMLTDSEKAIADFTKAIELDPNSAKAYHARAGTLCCKDDYSAAIKDFSKALQINPKFTKAYLDRSEAACDIGNWELALADADAAMALDPTNATAYLYRGNARRGLGNLDAALSDFSQTIAFDPKSGGAYLWRALTQWQKGNLKKAVSDYETAISLGFDAEKIIFSWARQWSTNRCWRDAVVCYSLLIHMQPGQIELLENRGYAYYSLKEFDKAIEDYSEMIRIDPKSHAGYRRRAIAYYMKEQYDEAISDSNEAIRLAPDQPEYYKLRAGIQEKLIRRENAGFEARRNRREVAALSANGTTNKSETKDLEDDLLSKRSFLDSDQFNKNPDDLFSPASNKNGQTTEDNRSTSDTTSIRDSEEWHCWKKTVGYRIIVADLTKAIELDPDNAEYRNCRGQYYVRLEEYDKALDDFNEVVRRKPDWGGTYIHRAKTLKRLGRLGDALADCETALRLDPTNPEPYRICATIYIAEGKKAKADAELAKVRELTQPATVPADK